MKNKHLNAKISLHMKHDSQLAMTTSSFVFSFSNEIF